MPLTISHSPPPDWDRLVHEPCHRAGFAMAMQTMGYRPLYLHDGDLRALALARGWVRGLRRLLARVTLFAPRGDSFFVSESLSALAALGIPYVKVGDTMWGLAAAAETGSWPASRTTIIRRYTFVLDLAQTEARLLARQDGSVRTSVRKAARAGVEVREIASSSDLAAYCKLAHATSARVRRVTAYTDFPASFFAQLYVRLAPGGAARFYLASIGDTPLAGAVFLCSRDRMLYFAGASTRERDWTPLQAPTAVLWHAIRQARHLGMSQFDFGGCTPTDDPRDPRHGVYLFKKRWGGDLNSFTNLEVVLSPLSFYLQEHALAPLWDRVHPLYFRLLGTRTAS